MTAPVRLDELAEQPVAPRAMWRGVVTGLAVTGAWWAAMWLWPIPTFSIFAATIVFLFIGGFARSLTEAKAQRHGW